MASSMTVEGLQGAALGSGCRWIGGSVLDCGNRGCFGEVGMHRVGLIVRSATQSEGSGTRLARKLKVLQVGDKSASLRDRAAGQQATIKLLSRVEQLRLLSKAEKAGLLSAAENAGISFALIEKLGLLSKAEEFGALSAATDPGTPKALLAIAFTLLVAGPLFVYYVPEDSTFSIVIQAVVATLSIFGGSAAFAASNFVSALQKSD